MDDKEHILNTFSADMDEIGAVQAKYEVRATNLGTNLLCGHSVLFK